MNQVHLSATVVDRPQMRHTPAGLAIQELILEHNEQVIEAGKPRTVHMRFPVKVMGDKAHEAATLPIGAKIECEGFLAQTRFGAYSLQLRLIAWRIL